MAVGSVLAGAEHPTPAAPTGPGAASWGAVRPLLLRIHFYAGVFVAPFLVVAALTGLAYTTMPQVERVVYRHELTVPVGGQRLSVAAQVAAARAAHPEGTVTAIRPSATATASTRVIMDVPGLADGTSRTVFVDPYTGRVLGAENTVGEWLPVRAWFDNLHRTLQLGTVGRTYSELAASWLWVVVLGGLVLWLSGRRRAGPVRRRVLPRSRPAGRSRVLSWHGVLGLWAAAGFLFLSATGLTWSHFAGDNIAAIRGAWGWSTPTVSSAVDPAAARRGEVGVDRALAAAASRGVGGPVQIDLPAEPGQAYVVHQVQRSWPEKQDSAAIDPATGRVTSVLRFDDWPVAAKLARWGVDAHMGLLFGLANQIVLAGLAVVLIVLIVLGYRMWWLRRPGRGWGRRPHRGAWRRVSARVLAPLLLAAVVLGWLVPELGASLAAFVALDVAAGWRSRRRAVAR
jgi:uncharacterized iron-regulated membrane protein